MALYLKWFTLATIDSHYVLKHKSNLRNPKEVERRIEVLKFWEKHGLQAALDHAGISKATIYRWRKALEGTRALDRRMGRASLKGLDPKSTRPKNCRQAKYNKDIVNYLIETSKNHPELGRRMLYHMLRNHLQDVGELAILCSESTVGRILNHLRNLGRIQSKTELTYNARTDRFHTKIRRRITKQRRKNLPFKIAKPGDLVQIDGIEGHIFGAHYYILNCIDYASGYAVSMVLNNKSSQSTANALKKLPDLFGFTIKAIQTDNGSEYAAKFHATAEVMNITHCFNYVRKPIYNGKVERFNRTLKEAVFYRRDFMYDLAENKEKANQTIQEYMNFYNNKRPHSSINYRTPQNFVLQYA